MLPPLGAITNGKGGFTMKSKFTLLAAGLLLVTLLGGCESRQDESSSSSSSSSLSQEESGSSQAVGTPIDEEALTAALEGITYLEVGTAGSSLKVYIAAARLMDFAQEYDDATQKEALTDGALAYLFQLGENASVTLSQNLILVNNAAQGIFSGDETALAAWEDAGSPGEYDSYSADRFNSVMAVLQTMAPPELG